METFEIQRWLFDEAAGKFSTDLGESGVYRQEASILTMDPSWDLDYSVDQGSPRLRGLLEGLYKISGAKESIVTSGGQEALYLYYNVLVQPGDEVITTTPGWQQSWSVPQQLGAHVKKVAMDGKYLNPAAVADAIIESISAETRLVVLTNPNNPLGTVLDNASMARMAAAVREVNGQILVDEEYMPDYENSAIHLADNVTVVSSLSKIHGVPGLRIGWAIGPTKIIHEMVNYRRFSTVANSTLSERFAEQVLEQHEAHVSRFSQLSENGKRILEEVLGADDRLRTIGSHATPFTWVQLPDEVDPDEFARRILDECQVLVMPASVFETGENAVRVTHAREPETLRHGLDQFLKVLASMTNG